MNSPYQTYKHLGEMIVTERGDTKYKYPYTLHDELSYDRTITYAIFFKIPIKVNSQEAILNLLVNLENLTTEESIIEPLFNKAYGDTFVKYIKNVLMYKDQSLILRIKGS